VSARALARFTSFEELPHQVCCAGKEHATFLFGRFDADGERELRLRGLLRR